MLEYYIILYMYIYMLKYIYIYTYNIQAYHTSQHDGVNDEDYKRKQQWSQRCMPETSCLHVPLRMSDSAFLNV